MVSYMIFPSSHPHPTILHMTVHYHFPERAAYYEEVRMEVDASLGYTGILRFSASENSFLSSCCKNLHKRCGLCVVM